MEIKKLAKRSIVPIYVLNGNITDLEFRDMFLSFKIDNSFIQILSDPTPSSIDFDYENRNWVLISRNKHNIILNDLCLLTLSFINDINLDMFSFKTIESIIRKNIDTINKVKNRNEFIDTLTNIFKGS